MAGENIVTIQGQMRTLLAYLETPVLITSANYKTAYINPSFEKSFIVAFRETLGKDISAFMAPSSAELLVKTGEEAKNRREPLRVTLNHGSLVFNIGASPIVNEDGRITGLVYNFTDVTKDRQLEQVKADFISMLLNDLRTPILEISKSLEKIKSTLDPKSPLLQIAESGWENSNDVLKHLEQLLHVTESISGELHLTLTEVDAVMLLSTAIGSLKNTAGKTGVTAEQYSLRRLPSWKCDREKILQVLIFIIAEQIKSAGPGGTVTVGANVSYKGDRPKKLFFSAAQPTKTLDRTDMPELFGEDVHGTSYDPTKMAVRKIIEAHKGTLSIQGVEGHGCAFTAAFPLQ